MTAPIPSPTASPRLKKIDLTESVAGEEDPGASIDLSIAQPPPGKDVPPADSQPNP